MSGRILVVEDAAANIQVLTAILKEKGYDISVASNGRQALKVLTRVRPDLILLDIMMPEMDGFETCIQIKQSPDWQDIPLIFLTAKTETSDIVRGFELGAVDYVAKPFHAHELLARVDTHLKMDRLRRENERLVRDEAELARHRSVAEMVAGVAHELNTPLGVINTATSILKRWIESADLSQLQDVSEATELITRNVSRAHKLVQDFKRVSVHQVTDVLEPARLVEVVSETIHLFRVTARQSPLEVVLVNQLSDQQGEWLGYAGSLSQVLLNLLSNAQRYAYPEGKGGRIEVLLGSEPDGGYLLIVRDFGAGIAAANLPRIFEPFFTTGRSKGGSGLGLSIVHTLVTAHLQGAIAVDSQPGQGTTITVRLPREVRGGSA